MREELERRAARRDQDVIEYALEWLENGKTLTDLAADLTAKLKLDEEGSITRSMVSKYLNQELGATDELELARTEGAHGMAESSLLIIDEAADSREKVAHNKNRAEMRIRLAGFMNSTYRDQRGTNINLQVNNGQMHLDALRSRVMPARVVQPILPPAGPDVEVVTDAE